MQKRLLVQVEEWVRKRDDDLKRALARDKRSRSSVGKYAEDAQSAVALHRRSPRGESLGELKFFEGPCPGSNWTWVETDDGLVLASLQRRLLELGEDVRLQVQSL